MNPRKLTLLVPAMGLVASACVEHRPVRNGLSNESIYLDKAALSQPDTQFTETTDDNWIYRVTVVGASSPNVVGDYAFPGLEGNPTLVKVRFRDDALQLVETRRLQADLPDDPNDNLSSTEDNVLLEFAGQHVDVKLQESLDGERTNLLSENTEEPWQKRQKFKVDFASTSLDPITNAAWFYGEFMAMCASTVAVHYTPDSFQWQKACTDEEIQAEYGALAEKWAAASPTERDALRQEEGKCSLTGGEALGFEVEVTYLLTIGGGCYNMTSLASGTGTSTIKYRFSLYRPKTGTYVEGEDGESVFQPQYTPVEIGEKDITNKQYGVFQILNLFTDHDAGELSAVSLMQRWNPDRTDTVAFYYQPGFPERFKPFFADVESATNDVLEAAGAKLRFAFREYDDGGIVRHPGDQRFSFVNWHHDIDTTRGLLGYGPSTADPRTGEVYSATLNLYNVGMDYYRFLVENFLEAKGAQTQPEDDPSTEADESKTPWDEIECAEGSTVAPKNATRCEYDSRQAGLRRQADCEAAKTADPALNGERDCEAEATEATTTSKDTCLASPRLTTAIFGEMRRVMDVPEDQVTGEKTDFVPTPTREDFTRNYMRMLPELRFSEPVYNAFVYRGTDGQSLLADLPARREEHDAFLGRLMDVQNNQNPFGPHALHTREGIDAQNDFLDGFRSWKDVHERLAMDEEQVFALRNVELFDATDAVNAVSLAARKCVARDGDKFTFESDAEFSRRIVDNVVFKTAIHEFGHNLGLRHNFYGSVDAAYQRENEISASVMDYVSPIEEAEAERQWGRYDELALQWIYGNAEKRAAALEEKPLYCTDEHRLRSPMCRAFDLGITPAQVVLNAIERYDWLYELRNKRAWRKFWDTSSYAGSIYDSVFSIQRMWHMALFDWGGGGVQSLLKRLDQVERPDDVLTDQEYDEISVDFYNDISAAVGMTMAFYDAIINQSASFRNYQTEFDPFYGDTLRIGIIIDKLFATFAFMDLQDVSGYNPNVATYVSMYDAPFGSRNLALSQRVLDNMLGANYDTFPWFKYYALNIFASVTNSNLIGNVELRDRIAIKRYNRAEDLAAEFGDEALVTATSPDNLSGLFEFEGEEYVYTYIEDRAWHLVASRSKSPVSYQFIREYNEALRANADPDNDNYGLKILLAYYEYYNNFVGY
ncbi:MAG: zinc-dependent metalloprotease [Bradymonadia bacterium]